MSDKDRDPHPDSPPEHDNDERSDVQRAEEPPDENNDEPDRLSDPDGSDGAPDTE